MRVSYFNYKVWLYAFLLALGMANVADVVALAQVTEEVPQLERIDIEAPQRRPAARTGLPPEQGLVTTREHRRLPNHPTIRPHCPCFLQARFLHPPGHW
ncbi:hypothetical protein [Desulfomonile tiedjei]|uniref:Uncharacterized protein n=1 Tax=Desulfomonile tiedjei (strain ATCC 49306 / DSM 6799 / DCB-1) TaxID=706587 RepID=I4C1L2_DESTA|nr:hypothetical protein [Desulfomonile tiedjei]AFM23453.1 hypothetical protein Desti_0727 [Desulfomonile tiedjei DSM 6799]